MNRDEIKSTLEKFVRETHPDRKDDAALPAVLLELMATQDSLAEEQKKTQQEQAQAIAGVQQKIAEDAATIKNKLEEGSGKTLRSLEETRKATEKKLQVLRNLSIVLIALAAAVSIMVTFVLIKTI